ncbi:MAG: GumC family protein [Cyanobacteriota bacterium]|jgi:succinoglycan biosynthesis transport protein ExoP
MTPDSDPALTFSRRSSGEAGTSPAVNGARNGSFNEASPAPGASRGPQSQIPEELNLRQAWFVLKHRLRLIVAITCGVTTAVGVWTFQQTPVYEGHFQLLVGDPVTEQNAPDQALLESMGVREVDYETQIEVLRSASILKPILKAVQRQYPLVDYDTLTQGNRPPLKISQVEDTKILKVAYQDVSRSQIQFLLDELSKAYLRYSLDERKTQINQGMKFVDDQLPQLRKRVNERQAELERFRQRYNLLDPEQRAKELSALEFNLQSKYIELEVAQREAQSMYEALQKQLGLSPENALASSYLTESPRYQNLLNQLQALEVEISQQSARYLEDSPVMQELLEKRENLLPLIAQEAQAVLGGRLPEGGIPSQETSSPSTVRINLNQQFIQTANQLQVLQARRASLAKELGATRAQIQAMPALARQYTDLQREAAVATDSLNRFLEAQAKLQIDSSQQTVPWQLISPTAIDELPVWPRPVRNISLGLIAGLLLGVAIAFLLERLDPVFHSVEEIKEDTQVPILGMIPWQKDLSNLDKVVEMSLPTLTIGKGDTTEVAAKEVPRAARATYQSSGFLEAFRSLNTNVWLLGADHPIRSVVISSSTPADGKSTVSLHLALAASAMGQKVLLVDADLRRPRVHTHFGLLNGQGLSNIIATGLAPEEAIQRAPQWENLSILTAGDIPPDPIRLLTSRRMQELMADWEKNESYDLIIYDTPPLLNFADARILGAATAGLIYVLKLGKTDRTAFKHVLDDINLAQVPLLGLVANGITRNDYGGSNYYYYYRYGRRN